MFSAFGTLDVNIVLVLENWYVFHIAATFSVRIVYLVDMMPLHIFLVTYMSWHMRNYILIIKMIKVILHDKQYNILCSFQHLNSVSYMLMNRNENVTLLKWYHLKETD